MRDTALKLESGGSHPTWTAGPSGDSGREDGMSRGPVGDSCTVQPSTRRLQGQLPATVPGGRTALLQPSLTANTTDTWGVQTLDTVGNIGPGLVGEFF